ncbi:flagellar hook-basal body complex protein [Vibrio sp. Of14-4]|uniref:flagellar hook-basal body protein n=1 Tax=Vibrio sp. Of14-4 TaxID=2724878 RepID=UPI001EF186C4|nr:flagellar hook-basal body complex protein [Vibrio sp. Of14-4]MCG7489156.1 flagellar hook-basal body complex protein [Vibrio sp. Of14-4]
MIEALSKAEMALRTHQQHIDMISNNVSNINTPGYKASTPVFNNLVSPPSSDESSQLEIGHGVEISGSVHRFTDGEYKFTGSPFDLAIQGNGLLEVELENGETAFTRVAALKKLHDGSLATVQGHKLSANVTVPPDVEEVKIDRNGKVLGSIRGESELLSLGQLELVLFDAAEALKMGDQGLWYETELSGQRQFLNPGEDGAGTILQGYTEMSNVNMIEEMVTLMAAQRAYQLNSRVIQTSDQILETINNLIR